MKWRATCARAPNQQRDVCQGSKGGQVGCSQSRAVTRASFRALALWRNVRLLKGFPKNNHLEWGTIKSVSSTE